MKKCICEEMQHLFKCLYYSMTPCPKHFVLNPHTIDKHAVTEEVFTEHSLKRSNNFLHPKEIQFLWKSLKVEIVMQNLSEHQNITLDGRSDKRLKLTSLKPNQHTPAYAEMAAPTVTLVRMTLNELETSYINSVAPAPNSSEPAVLIENPRTHYNQQADRIAALTSPKKEHLKQSRRLPFWLWYIIAKTLGLKLKPNDKPICAIILYILTLLSALGYIITSIWYSVYNVVANEKAHTAQLHATVKVLLTALWCALGVYANKLAYRLFGHRKFLAMLRLHSKTVFKLNAAFVVLFLWSAFIILYNLGTMKYWIGTPCSQVSLDRVVCQVHYGCQVIFSIFALLWNVLVAVVLISVCRTHTISIRRFILELEKDAFICDPTNEAAKDLANDYAFVDEDYFEDLAEDSDDTTNDGITKTHNNINVSNNTLSTVDEGCASADSAEQVNPASPGRSVMSNADILHRYWCLMVKLRISSMALQRWMVSVMALTIVWAAINLVQWLSHDPHVYDVLNFIIPLLLLPLLCSAYSEVNNEGFRVPKCIKPIHQRLELLQYMLQIPLQMTVFNHPITYATISTVAAGFLLALVSKMLMEDITSLV